MNKEKIIDQAGVLCGGNDYTIIRYKDASIRIIKKGETDPVKNSKDLLRRINEEHDLGLKEEDFKKLNTIGKRIIDLLNNKPTRKRGGRTLNKLQSIRKKGDRTLIAIVIIGVAVYIGFTPLFEKIQGGVAGAVIAASFGAIFVIVLTMYLLNKQTEIEQESKKGERVFDEKVKLYKRVLKNTKEMVEDGEISAEEIDMLPFLMMELQMLGGDETISTYEDVFSTINEIFEKNRDEDVVAINETEKKKIYKKMSKFARNCRVDLGVSDREINKELFDRTITTIQTSSQLYENREALERNRPLLEEDLDVKARVSCGGSDYTVKRYKNASIRIIKKGETDPVKNSKALLRRINEEHDLGLKEEDFKKLNTRAIGKRIIDLWNKK